MLLPQFPEFEPLRLDFQPEMRSPLAMTPDGVSEFTFAGLYLFRGRYQYRVSLAPEGKILISGEREGKKFFMAPCGPPPREILSELFEAGAYWKGISDSVLAGRQEEFSQWGIEITEDRDNFDYLYLRDDLARLVGKKYHKKRNLVNGFINTYRFEERPLKASLVPQALEVLERWRLEKDFEGDYDASREALEHLEELKLRGTLYLVNGRPAGWCLGESLARGRMFAVHFEKGLDEYKGIYQFINQAFAASLPAYYTHINREQDLGDEGLRQAKMTYRPSGFVRKYTGRKAV